MPSRDDDDEGIGAAASGGGGSPPGLEGPLTPVNEAGEPLGPNGQPLESGRPLESADAEDDGGSGLLDTLLEPVVLLLIAGVVTAAVGMAMARRSGGGGGGEPGQRANPRPLTPDGEILGADEEN